MIVTNSQMIAAEQAVIASGVTAEALMEEAAAGIFKVLRQFYPEPGTAILYLGKGNNAGDALVLARHLHAAGWKLLARCVSSGFDPSAKNSPPPEFKELPAKHWKALEGKITNLAFGDPLPGGASVVVIDGVTGTGASPAPVSGPYAWAVREMNILHRESHAFTLAIDLPTGLGAGDLVVEADLTVTIGHVKAALLKDDATVNVGRLALVPLKDVGEVSGADATQRLLTSGCLLHALPTRPFEFHKGQAGRVGIVAGSRGFLGAAVLASSGALRGGAGLVTLYVKEDLYPLIAALPPAEVMVRPVRDYGEVLRDPLDAIAIGPGLGMEHEDEVLELLSRAESPVVVDADALNMLARRGLDILKQGTAARLLTPHPGEMARMAEHCPEWKSMSRAELARDFIAKFPHVALLLKGSRSLIAASGRPLSFNSTGHPGMASGGMGDVLTGLCAALAAQGVTLYNAACLGAWLNGRAAERAIYGGSSSQESLNAGDVLQHLGGAFRDLKQLRI